MIILVLAGVLCGIVALAARDGRRLAFAAMLQRRLTSLRLALLTTPRPQTWPWFIGLATVHALIAWRLGRLTGFLRPATVKGSWRKFVIVPAALLIQPGLLEELIFRVLLLPHPTEKVPLTRTVIGSTASLLAFVLYHPINGLTFTPAARSLFTNIAFLVQAALLGLICTLAYLISGSIWPSVLMHWLPVTVWILFFDGAKRVSRAQQFNSY